MKTLDEIRNEIAKENGYKDWDDLHDFYVKINSPFNIILDEVARRYAKEVAQDLKYKVIREARVSPMRYDEGCWEINEKSVMEIEIIC